MKTKQPYLKYEFSLDDLASLLEVPKHHLYYCFRNVLHTKFTRLRTEYRIEHAKRLLNETDLSRTTLDAIGKNSGFSSRSGFYNTFKEELGCSPGEYIGWLQIKNRLKFRP
jgi:AraC-like DNA-binding protein